LFDFLNSRRPKPTDLESVAFDQAPPSLHIYILITYALNN